MVSRSHRQSTASRRAAIFIAVEGVIWDRHELAERPPCAGNAMAGALDGLRLLAQADAPIYLVTTERATALGANPCAALEPLGIPSAGLVACPRRADAASRRKALVDALRRRARRDHLALDASLLIGDTWSLAQLALELSCQPVLVMTGRGRAQIAQPQTTTVRARTWYAADLALAACSVLAQVMGERRPFAAARPHERRQSTVA